LEPAVKCAVPGGYIIQEKPNTSICLASLMGKKEATVGYVFTGIYSCNLSEVYVI
jgi:hypothetical protein